MEFPQALLEAIKWADTWPRSEWTHASWCAANGIALDKQYDLIRPSGYSMRTGRTGLDAENLTTNFGVYSHCVGAVGWLSMFG